MAEKYLTFNDLPAVRVTEDAHHLARMKPRDRLPKYDDNCISKEHVVFTEELADEMMKATSPLQGSQEQK